MGFLVIDTAKKSEQSEKSYIYIVGVREILLLLQAIIG